MKQERLDILVQHQTGFSRSKAQGLIHTGHVFDTKGNRLNKPGGRYPDDTTFEIRDIPKFVSRGGQKIEHGLEEFNVCVSGKVAIDVGASTGGFTDCMLQKGAEKVYAVDVGYGQLAWKLRQDDRVVVMERTNIRHATPDQFPDKPTIFVADCSFISLKLVLPPLLDILARPAEGVVLIKPQFEAGRAMVGKGGVVRDEAVHKQVIEDVTKNAQKLGFDVLGITTSPLIGPAGNKEFLAHLVLA